MAFASGVCALAGLYHLLIGVRRGRDPVNLSFAVLCLIAAAWIAFGALKYGSTDPAAVSAVVRIRLLQGHLLAIAGVWFFAFFAGERPRAVLWGLTALEVCFIVLNQFSTHPLYFSGVPELLTLTTPWGEPYTVATGPHGWGYVLEFFISVPVALFVLWLVYRKWSEDRRALPLALAAVALIVGFLASVVAFEIAFPTAEFGFLILILIMGLALADEVAEVGEVRGALSETQDRMRMVLEAAPEAMLLLDGETGLATTANTVARDLFGLRDADVRSFRPLDWAPAEQPDGSPSASVWDRRWVSALAGNRPSFPWLANDAAGAPVSTEAQMIRLPGESGPVIRLSLLDLRNLEAAEAHGARLEEQLHQSLKLEAVGRLTGGVAHDFNNFLTVMRGSLELLIEDGVDAEEQRQLISEALAAADRSASLTQRLLAFSRRQPLAPRRVDMNGVVEQAGTLLRRTLGEHIRMEYDIPDDIWPIFVDSAQLESALVNLSINAADAMETGGRLAIGARNVHLEKDDYEFLDQLSPGRYVRIHVSDTGHGMDEMTLARVVEPFFTTKEVGKGTGLGLSMVYGFATQSGGTLRITSQEGRGTTVYLYFPMHEEAPVGAIPAEGQPA